MAAGQIVAPSAAEGAAPGVALKAAQRAARRVAQRAARRAATQQQRAAVIDIGSNSVRLVVFAGAARCPATLFNEKVMAGLGAGIGVSGALSAESMQTALDTLARYARLVAALRVESLRAVATAAVRRASNGAEFIARVRQQTGIAVEILDGEVEARNSALGVLAGIPGADGIVGDLGGGSLELARVANGEVTEVTSLPLGALRLTALHQQGRAALLAEIRAAVRQLGWHGRGAGRPFYAVGGSWRALVQLHMQRTRWPLPIVHQYRLTAAELPRLVRALAHLSDKSLRRIPELSRGRIPQLPGTAALLQAIVRDLGSDSVIASAYGLREGLLFGALPPPAQRADPLLVAARDCARRDGRQATESPAQADALAAALLRFSDGLFAAEAPPLRRLRQAACLLADTSWRAHPELRAEDAVDRALHGTWVGIEAGERAMLAAALWEVNGGGKHGRHTDILRQLAPPDDLARARRWGLVLRLGLRLAGGGPTLLESAALGRSADGRLLWLSLSAALHYLYDQPVAKRHKLLAQAFSALPELRLSPSRVPPVAANRAAAS